MSRFDSKAPPVVVVVVAAALLLVAGVGGGVPRAQVPAEEPSAAATPAAGVAADGGGEGSAAGTPSPAANGSEGEESLTDAERISRLRRAIEADEESLARLRAEVENPESEYARAEREFGEIDRRAVEQEEELGAARAAGDAERVAQLEAVVEAERARRSLARERFDLAIEERKTSRGRIEVLERNIARGRAELARLEGVGDAVAGAVVVGGGSEVPGGGEAPATPATPATPAASPAAAGPSAADAAMMALTGMPPSQPAPATGEVPAPAPSPTPPNERVAAAQEEAERTEAAAVAAEQEAATLEEAIASLRETIALEERALRVERRKVENSVATQQALEEEYRRGFGRNAPRAELAELQEKIDEARERARLARVGVTETSDRLSGLQRELSARLGEQLRAQMEASERRAEARESAARVALLSNPFHPRNLLDWMLRKGPRLLAIILGIMLLRWVARIVGDRFVYPLALGSTRREEEDEERDARAQTLATVFKNTARLLVLVVGTIMILEEIGIPVGPLLGGAAVAGLAVAFGAQNLIRDYFTGFTILLENQYQINDVVKIAGISGLVERITLRVTTLRDLEGTVHFIPNGQITTVSNMTHEWSRAVFDVGVAHSTDIDRLLAIIADEGKKLRADPRFRRDMLADLEMLGLDAIADSALVVKFLIKTRPLKQWGVKREMLLRLKRRFDAEGIEIPFPQRTVWVRQEAGAATSASWAAAMVDARPGEEAPAGPAGRSATPPESPVIASPAQPQE